MNPDGASPGDRRRAARAARGEAPFDLLLSGAVVADVMTGELREADVGLCGPLIASVHPRGTRRDAGSLHDLSGLVLGPGLIDSHLHFESSFMAPADYASATVPHGLTTAVWDPHELANVAGLDGVRWALSASRGLPLRVVVAAPSCVPSAPGLEVAGAEFGPAEVAEMLRWPGVGGVAEVMDMAGLLSGDPRMVGIVEAGLATGRPVFGHARGLSGGDLQAYAASGVSSDHEVASAAEALERLRAGMVWELRGSHDHVLPEAVAALAALPALPTGVVLCTDDVFPDELVEKGGLRDTLARVIARGLDPVLALRCATLHPALRLNRPDLGLVGPGRLADLAAFSDLATARVERTYAAGRLVAVGGAMLEPLPRDHATAPRGTVRLSRQSPEAFRLRVRGVAEGRAVLPVAAGARFSRWARVEVAVRGGVAELPAGHALVAVLHRHGRSDPAPRLSLVEGWGEPAGALATTVAHDSHNLLVLGRAPEDMAAAANAVVAAGGGMAVAAGGRARAVLPLPIAGLLAETPPAETARAFAALRRAADAAMEWAPPNRVFRGLTGIALACNPGPRPTDRGLADAALGRVLDPSLPLAPEDAISG